MKRPVMFALAVLIGSHAADASQEPPARPGTPEQRLEKAETEIQALWHSYYVAVRNDLPDTKASVDCSSAQYGEVKATNSFLVFFVACERIEPHAGGYRATLAIGNPHAFGFRRVSGTLSYGENIAAALVRETQRVPFSTSTEVRPGTWTRIHVPIASAAEKDLSKIVVEFETIGAIAQIGLDPVRPTSTPQHGMLRP